MFTSYEIWKLKESDKIHANMVSHNKRSNQMKIFCNSFNSGTFTTTIHWSRVYITLLRSTARESTLCTATTRPQKEKKAQIERDAMREQ